jgi:nitrile hydratase
VLHVVDHQPNPEELAYGRPGLPRLPVYRVRFDLAELWPDDAPAGRDGVVVDLFEPWLEPVEESR